MIEPLDFTADQYIDDILSGKIVACRWVKLACERHLRDLETGHERGLYFDVEAAKNVIAFFHLLPHWKGEWAGTFIKLEPPQQFWLWSIFGWKNDDGTRRFNTAYLEVARKNTKTTLAAGVALYMGFYDGEKGAEIYSAATKKDQAKIVFEDAVQMIKAAPHLQLKLSRNKISDLSGTLKFEPLAADSDSLDGLNIHAAIADEVHQWRGDDLWAVLETATGSRLQSLIFAITTAGTNQQGVCYRQREYVTRLLKQINVDDSYFGIIYTLDTRQDWPDLEADDDWQDPTNWIKANPLLGVSKYLKKMEQGARLAANIPQELNKFLRFHLNIWTQALTRWVNPLHWRECGELGYSEESLLGRPCYGGLDLAQIYDLAAFVLVFPPQEENEPYKIVTRFWLPKDSMIERVKRDQVGYDYWAKLGHITLTPGNVIDYHWIEAEIIELAQKYQIVEIGYDAWGASQISQNLQDVMGPEWVVPLRQGFVSFSGPTKELGRLIASKGLAHNNNPVLNWMSDNLVVRIDPAGNIKPDKEKSREKIDGIVALIMGVNRSQLQEANYLDEFEMVIL